MAVRSSKTSSDSWLSDYKELLSLIFLSVALYVGISLYSYNPLDPSFQSINHEVPTAIHNFGGVIGSYLADGLLTLFGFASYIWVASLIAFAVYMMIGRFEKVHVASLLGWIMMLVTVAVVLTIFDTHTNIIEWGGWVGEKLQAFFVRYTGTYGMWLCVVTAFLGSLHLTIKIPYEEMGLVFSNVWFFAKAQSTKLFSFFMDLAERTQKRLHKKVEKEEKKLQEGFEQIKKENQNIIPIQKAKSAKPKLVKAPDVPIVIPERKKQTEEILPDREETIDTKEKKSSYTLPKLMLLEDVPSQELEIDRDTLLENASILENKLKDFGVLGKVVEVQPGPVVTMYEFEPAAGVKVNKITSLGDDLTLALRALSVRIALIPGKSVIGIEVSNPNRQVVFMKEIIGDANFQEHKSKLAITLGKDISGNPEVADLRKMPHLLVAGATGSGKSVSINSMLVSVLYKATPDDVRMILVDPKMLELSLYDEIPHLLLPVVTDPRKASAALKWAVREMEKRYRLMADLGVRNVEGYNAKVENHMKKNPRASYEENMEVPPETHEGRMPYIMIVIDELA
ncbi:MAG: DNA translocase FtsK 4TM domain-containing protein, partial [Bdellovibrionales bacterium]|nr:DNA translocase FtsK 4TM domain-containing protein [Bdellovibrionales bacterium]